MLVVGTKRQDFRWNFIRSEVLIILTFWTSYSRVHMVVIACSYFCKGGLWFLCISTELSPIFRVVIKANVNQFIRDVSTTTISKIKVQASDTNKFTAFQFAQLPRQTPRPTENVKVILECQWTTRIHPSMDIIRVICLFITITTYNNCLSRLGGASIVGAQDKDFWLAKFDRLDLK